MDLLETATGAARSSRKKIVSLLQNFKSIRQSMKCSAKNLVNVNDVFVKAQHSVRFPIRPLYDLSQGKLTPSAVRAFRRIFRIFDADGDGLLSLAELNSFQKKCFPALKMTADDWNGWKKALLNNYPSESVFLGEKMTCQGFLAMFDVFVSSDRLDTPWTVLRNFGYDDDLVLDIPDTVTSTCPKNDWKLSDGDRNFLTDTFFRFDTDGDGVLLENQLIELFQVLPPPALPPWHPTRRNLSVQAQPAHPVLSSLSYLDWMSRWYAFRAMDSASANEELYLLGQVQKRPYSFKISKNYPKTTSWRQIPVRIALVSDDTSSLYSHFSSPSSQFDLGCSAAYMEYPPRNCVLHFIFIPVDENQTFQEESYDFVILGFHINNKSSLDYILRVESFLKADYPRAFFALDQNATTGIDENITHVEPNIYKEAINHCNELDLEHPLLLSPNTTDSNITTDKKDALNLLVKMVLDIDGIKTKPHAERRRRDAAK